MTDTFKIAILGASGYTGAELVRLIATHPQMEIVALSAERKAGMTMTEVFPHLRHLDLPTLTKIDKVVLEKADLVFAALPHGVTHGLAKTLPKATKLVDLSADFRLRDAADYKQWYGLDHSAMEIQPSVAYGLPEFNRTEIADAQITANTGCYVVTSLLPLIPILKAGLVAVDNIVIDAKSGATGAGRAPNEATLFCEVSEGFHPYAVGHHRHMGELDQEMSLAAGTEVKASFTPHLLPQNRGIEATIYLQGKSTEIHSVLSARFSAERFVEVLPFGSMPATRHVRGSNMCHIGVKADRQKDRTIIVSVTDNLIKGASGQALQNANIMLGLPEEMGLEMAPMFP